MYALTFLFWLVIMASLSFAMMQSISFFVFRDYFHKSILRDILRNVAVSSAIFIVSATSYYFLLL